MPGNKHKLEIARGLPPEADEDEGQISATTSESGIEPEPELEAINANPFSAERRSNNSGNDGGNMNLEQRVYNLENGVTDIKINLERVKTRISSRARQKDLTELKEKVTEFKSKFDATLPHLATKDEIFKTRNWIIGILFGLFLAGQLINYFIPNIHNHDLESANKVQKIRQSNLSR